MLKLAFTAAIVCAAACVPSVPPAVVSMPAITVQTLERPVPYPVTHTPAFARAIQRGTRTREGAPGPNYWQQFARYSIEATLDPATKRITGTERVTYYNRSPDALRQIVVHLYQNIHRPDAVRNDRVPVTEGMTLQRVVANGDVLTPVDTADTAGDGVRVYGTTAFLQLRSPVAPGDSAVLELSWRFTVPPAPNIRMGADGDVFHLAYWYPQVAVYDDVNGWDTEDYLGDAEFYMGYADYDVALTVPAGWIVSATGELTNPREVLTERVRSRLAEARRSGSVVNVVTANERGAGSATATGSGLTWRFTARNVRDFAWNAGNRYVWDATRAVVGGDTVMIHALYRPDARSWPGATEYGRHAIEFLSRELWPYPWPHMTVVEGIITGGMEFPMITLIGSATNSLTELSLRRVTIHEIVHMWFPMIVGSNERAHTWQDEGFARFYDWEGTQEATGLPRDSVRTDRYVPLARTGTDVAMMVHGDLYPFERARTVAGYDKPAAVWRALRAMLGEETFNRAVREYGRRWAYKHPTPWDLFNTFDDVSGQRMGWFWRTWFFENWALDQAIARVTPEGDSLAVVIEDRGMAPMPVLLAVIRTTGTERIEVPADRMIDRRFHTVYVPNAATVTAIEIDPEGVFPDIDRANQRWTR